MKQMQSMKYEQKSLDRALDNSEHKLNESVDMQYKANDLTANSQTQEQVNHHASDAEHEKVIGAVKNLNTTMNSYEDYEGVNSTENLSAPSSLEKELSQEDYERLLQEQSARTAMEQEQEALHLQSEENTNVIKDEDDLEFEQNASLRRADPIRTNNVSSSFDLLVKKIEQLSGFKFDEAEVEPSDYDSMRKREASEIASEIRQKQDEYFNNYLERMRVEGNINPNIAFRTNAFISDQYNRIACETCISFIKNIIAGSSEPLLQIICGKAGTGKTSLCHAAANFFIQYRSNLGSFKQDERSKPWVIITTFDDIKKTWLFTAGETIENRNQREKLFNDFCEVKLLIIDGLCDDGLALDGFSQRILMNLLRTRAKSNSSILITTPYRPSELSQYVGANAYECMKEFTANATALLGPSRRHDIEDYTGDKLRNLLSSRNLDKAMDDCNFAADSSEGERKEDRREANRLYEGHNNQINNARFDNAQNNSSFDYSSQQQSFEQNANVRNHNMNVAQNNSYARDDRQIRANGMSMHNKNYAYEKSHNTYQGARADYPPASEKYGANSYRTNSNYKAQGSYNRSQAEQEGYHNYHYAQNYRQNEQSNFNVSPQNRTNSSFAQHNAIRRANNFNPEDI